MKTPFKDSLGFIFTHNPIQTNEFGILPFLLYKPCLHYILSRNVKQCMSQYDLKTNEFKHNYKVTNSKTDQWWNATRDVDLFGYFLSI